MANHYDVPNWAGKPPVGLHLDVMKDGKLIQKHMVDQKKCYLFGRNAHLNDFIIDHASCSRVHAAFVYHKHLKIVYLVDLGSTHGTFISSLRLEPHKPTHLQIGSQFHFGASTRIYVLRERPQSSNRPIIDELDSEMKEENDGISNQLGLPENEIELENLTEFNTAHNRRISMLGITDEPEKRHARKRKKVGVSFNEDAEIINLEDIDPSIGRFRNLVQTTVVPTSNNKRQKLNTDERSSKLLSSTSSLSLYHHESKNRSLYDDLPSESINNNPNSSLTNTYYDNLSNLSSKLGISLPNPAPDVEMMDYNEANNSVHHNNSFVFDQHSAGGDEPQQENEPKKKKYAKEAWPGKQKPGLF